MIAWADPIKPTGEEPTGGYLYASTTEGATCGTCTNGGTIYVESVVIVIRVAVADVKLFKCAQPDWDEWHKPAPEPIEPRPLPQYRQQSRPDERSKPIASEHVPEHRFARPPPERLLTSVLTPAVPPEKKP